VSGYNSDGIKIEGGDGAGKESVYEYNYVTLYEPPGSDNHSDGMQSSSDRDFVVRHSVVYTPPADGGNAAIFCQAWNGSSNYMIGNITIHGNYLYGGNYTVFLMGGKQLDNGEGLPKNYWLEPGCYTLTENTFEGGFNYGSLSTVADDTQLIQSGNIWP
jgi:hypothetical protein